MVPPLKKIPGCVPERDDHHNHDDEDYTNYMEESQRGAQADQMVVVSTGKNEPNPLKKKVNIMSNIYRIIIRSCFSYGIARIFEEVSDQFC
jgi:hypothetical protein